MASCRWVKEHGLWLDCGWNRDPVTYTYARAAVPEDVKQRFFEKVRQGIDHRGDTPRKFVPGEAQSLAGFSLYRLALVGRTLCKI